MARKLEDLLKAGKAHGWAVGQASMAPHGSPTTPAKEHY